MAEAAARIPAPLATVGTKDFEGSLPINTDLIDYDWLVAEVLRREASLLIHQAERRP